MEKYDNYKDSGIEWIGEIPEHWKISRIKFYLDYQKGKNPKELKFIETEETEVYLAMDYLRGNPKQMLYVEDVESYVKVDDNEILLLWDGSNAGEFVLSKKGILSSTMAVLNLKNIQKNFSWYYFKHFEPQLKESTIGMGVPHVNGEELKNGLIAIPPPEEQTAIANYLDRKTTEIDELIADKKRLLELYEEEKTAIINQAVTKGINPDVPLKDSGIEWLGEIPEHWGVKKIKHLLKKKKGALKTGPFGSQLKTSDLDDNGEYKVYTQRNVLDNDFIKGEDRIDEKKFLTLKDFLVEDGDILFTSRGTIGKCNVLPSEAEAGILHPCLIRIQIDRELVCEEWILNYANNSSYFLDNVKFESNSTIIDVIYGGTLKEIVLPLAPLEEQQSIVAYIETECALIDAKTENTKKLIDLLTEYRTVLISEVVTGKIEVTL